MQNEHQLTGRIVMRRLRIEDAAALADAYVRNREHLRPWEPERPDEFFSSSWQATDIANRIASTESGLSYSFALFDDETLVGRLNLTGIVRGPFQNAGLGYWVDGQYARGGLATAAVTEVVRTARDDLRLHRIEAATLVHNVASQRVLLKLGFEQIGTAPRYLKIAGVWQDHNLYQSILHD